jgi:AcrR family transcriptional regulator
VQKPVASLLSETSVASGGSAETDGPDASKGERTRSALLSAAIRRFALDGFHRTSVSDIARDVGVTAGAPYRYFADKEALFLAAVDADGAELIDLVRATVFGQLGGPISALLGRLADQLGAALDHHPLVARVMSGAEPMGPERIMALPNLGVLRGEITGLLRVGQEAGIVRAGVDPGVLALAIETTVLYQLAYIATLRGAETGPDEERWAAMAALVEAALDPGPR